MRLCEISKMPLGPAPERIPLKTPENVFPVIVTRNALNSGPGLTADHTVLTELSRRVNEPVADEVPVGAHTYWLMPHAVLKPGWFGAVSSLRPLTLTRLNEAS
jgi:hypothetical protein